MLIVEQWDEECGLWRLVKAFAPKEGQDEFTHDYSVEVRQHAAWTAARAKSMATRVRVREDRPAEYASMGEPWKAEWRMVHTDRIIWVNGKWTDDGRSAWIERRE